MRKFLFSLMFVATVAVVGFFGILPRYGDTLLWSRDLLSDHSMATSTCRA